MFHYKNNHISDEDTQYKVMHCKSFKNLKSSEFLMQLATKVSDKELETCKCVSI